MKQIDSNVKKHDEAKIFTQAVDISDGDNLPGRSATSL